MKTLDFAFLEQEAWYGLGVLLHLRSAADRRIDL